MPLTLSELRQWNTRHKNPQLVTQNCFVASFDRCFPFFTLRDQLDPQQKTFVAGWRNAVHWLVDSLEHEQSCCTPSCEFDEKRATKPEFVAQSRPALYFLQQLSSTCNKCFFCATSWSRKVKKGNIDENLQQSNVAWQVEGFCISYFATFTKDWVLGKSYI